MPTEPNVTLPVALAGVALAALGVARLARLGLRSMPVVVAYAVVGAGLGVGALGVVLPRLDRPATPTIELEPASPSSDPGAISGVVRDARGAPAPGTRVVLHRYDGSDERPAAETVAGTDGSFAFGELDTGPGTAYAVSADYDGTTFRSGVIVLGPHASQERVELVVASPTADASVIRADLDSTVLVGDRDGLEVVHILRVRNTSDDAYVGGLKLPILPRASGLDPRRGLDRATLALRDGRLVSSAPVLPGPHEIVYVYSVPMPRDGVVLARTLEYPTDRTTILAAPPLDVRAPRFTAARNLVKLGDEQRAYRSWERRGLEPGDRVRADASVGDRTAPWRTAAVALAVVAAASIVAFPLVRRRRVVPAAAEAS